MSQLKKRCEMDPKWMWNLNDIIPGTEAFNALFEKAEEALNAFAACQGHVAEDPRKAIMMSTEGERMIEKLYTYAGLHRDEDTGDEERQTLSARMDSLLVKIGRYSGIPVCGCLSEDQQSRRKRGTL